MDQFGIFREDFAPVLSVPNIPKTVPFNIKGKARGLGIKKKALGDVSNTVSQKVFNSKSADVNGKPSESCGVKPQKDLAASCKTIVQVEEEVLNPIEDDSDDFSPCKLCFDDFDYDVRTEDEKLTRDQIGQLTKFWTCDNLFPGSSMGDVDLDSDIELPSVDASFPIFMSTPLEFSPVISRIPLFD